MVLPLLRPRSAPALLAPLYFASGLAGLCYEVLWARLLGTQFGVSIFGVVLTVSAFMAGLGLGSLTGARWTARPHAALTGRSALRRFAQLELGVSLYALLLPWLARALGGELDAVAARLSLAQWYGVQGAVGLVLIAIPAWAMGAGFPMILAAGDPGSTAATVGRIYGANTLGAALGALFPLWGLPALGWAQSLRLAALAGVAVALTAFALARGGAAGDEPHPPRQQPAARRPSGLILLSYGGVGAAAIMLEIGWTRLYGMVLLRTEYVLAVILAVYLLGTALGSLLPVRLREARWLPPLMPFAAAGAALAGLAALPLLSSWIETRQFDSLGSALVFESLALGLLTLPVTIVLGAWLPMLAARSGSGSGAWLYGANSLGAALGAIAAGAVAIPAVGTPATVVLAALLLLAFGLAWSAPRRVLIAVPLAAVLAWPLHRFPALSSLMPAAHGGSRELFVYEDAISLNHVIEEESGQRLLLTDLQRMDASTEPAAVQIQADQARLPLLLHPAPHSVLFLGLGTGISASGSAPFPDLDRTAVELSRGAIVAAGSWFAPVNGNVALQMHVRRDDARRFLSADDRRYDVIVGDLFHPDLAGTGSLLSVEQFARARGRLAPGGLFTQWLTLNQFDQRSLDAVLRSFRRVFPQAQLFMDGMHLALVGPNPDGPGPAIGAAAIASNLDRLDPQAREAATGGEGPWTWLGRYWGPIADSTGPLQHEWMPFIEFRLPKVRYGDGAQVAALLAELLRRRPDAAAAAGLLGVAPADREPFARAYAATSLAASAWVAAIGGDADQAVQLERRAYESNPRDRWIANSLADALLDSLPQARRAGLGDAEALQRILRISPDHVETLRALWHVERSAGNAVAAEQYRSRLLAVSPFDFEARARAPDS